MFYTQVVEKIKTHILCLIIFSITSPPPENRAIYDTMWKSIIDPDRPQMTIRRMRTACYITKSTNTQTTLYTTHCFSTATMVARTRLIVMLYVQYLSCLASILLECAERLGFRTQK